MHGHQGTLWRCRMSCVLRPGKVRQAYREGRRRFSSKSRTPTGILIGIGETRRDRLESLLAIRRLHRRYGHVEELIVQNFRWDPEEV